MYYSVAVTLHTDYIVCCSVVYLLSCKAIKNQKQSNTHKYCM